jgi:hypothetical protein
MPTKAAMREKLFKEQEKLVKAAHREALKQVTVVRNNYKKLLTALSKEFEKNKKEIQDPEALKKLEKEYYKNAERLEKETLGLMKKAEKDAVKAAAKMADEIAPQYEKLLKELDDTPEENLAKPKKATTRKAPAESATNFEEGTEKEGAEGVIYVVKVIKNGTKRWMKK